jgi:ethanolamine utilization protein
MDMENLVEMITKEVMKRIKESSDIEEEKDKKVSKILVVESYKSDVCEKITNRINSEEFIADSVESMDNNLDVYDGIVVCSINNREFANLTVGVQCGQKEQIVISSILKGKEVFLIEEGIEYRKYKDTANKVFYSLYEEYEKKLISYGITLVKEEEIEDVLIGKKQYALCCDSEVCENHIVNEVEDGNPCCENDDTENEAVKNSRVLEIYDFTEKRLIAEADLKRVYRQGIREIKISKRTVLTPLVKDFIRTNNIKVSKIE